LKNKFHNKLLAISAWAATIFSSPAFAAQTTTHLSLKQIFAKFGIVMGLVIIAIIIIFVALTIAKKNKNFDQSTENIPKKSPLKTPENITEAVDFYINKNRL